MLKQLFIAKGVFRVFSVDLFKMLNIMLITFRREPELIINARYRLICCGYPEAGEWQDYF